MNYFYGIITLIFTLMTISASPQPKPEPYVIEEIREQKETLNRQKDCIKNIQSRQEKIADELSKIREMLKKDKSIVQ
tara:strand:+ start:2315 stop:2545 length:231 start_codon:yes stop_codon:yes gene_type:complete